MTFPSPTNRQTIPKLPIPEPIRSNITGTWAYSTITVRIAEIARRTLLENEFAPAAIERVLALIADIPSIGVRHLQQAGAPDAQDWQIYIEPYLGQDWLEAPWFFIETYFYRRLLEATGYFETGHGLGRDPFAYQKDLGLKSALTVIAALSERLQVWITHGYQPAHISALLAIDLWGNRADLSLWPADEGEQPSHAEWDALGEHTLVDNSDEAVQILNNNHGGRVDFVVDNAGLELTADLALTDYLLTTGAAAAVHLHLKNHPTFVSDAVIKDVQNTADFLANSADPDTTAFGRRLMSELADGRLILNNHPFWTSPFAFWEMPQGLRNELAQSTLIISKGDANYRRLLGDRYWPYTTSFQDIMAYTPAPLLALRAIKAEVASGLTQEQIDHLNQADPDWMVNGRWGVMQFAS